LSVRHNLVKFCIIEIFGLAKSTFLQKINNASKEMHDAMSNNLGEVIVFSIDLISSLIGRNYFGSKHPKSCHSQVHAQRKSCCERNQCIGGECIRFVTEIASSMTASTYCNLPL
jgi:hypothetical protein